MSAERGQHGAQRPPPLNTHLDHDLYGSYSRPVSSATNIIALYASSSDSGENWQQMAGSESYVPPASTSSGYDNGTPVAADYAERSALLSRPLPPPPPPPNQAPFAPHIRSPLPPTPASAPMQHREQRSPPDQRGQYPAHSSYEYEAERSARQPLPASLDHDASRFYTPVPPLHHTPSTASSHTTTSANSESAGFYSSHLSSYKPNTPPPWSPNTSIRSISSPSEPSTSQHSQRPSRKVDYGAGTSTVGSMYREDGREAQSGSRQVRTVDSLAASLAESTMEEEWPRSKEPNRAQAVTGQERRYPSTSSSHRGVPLPTVPHGTDPLAQQDGSSRRRQQASPGQQRPSVGNAELPPPERRFSPSSLDSASRPPPLPPLHLQESSYDFKDPSSFGEQPKVSPFWPPSTPPSGQVLGQQQESEDIEYCLLSTIALLLRDSVPRGVQIKGSVSYPYSFTGKDVVSTIQALVPKEVLAWAAGLCDGELNAAEERRIAVVIARTLKSQLFFHEVDWGMGELEDGVDEVYMFLEDSLAGSSGQEYGQANDFDLELSLAMHGSNDLQKGSKRKADGLDELPTGVFTALTSCYSPLCGKSGSPNALSCYSSSCPRAQSSPLKSGLASSLSAPFFADGAKAGASTGPSHMAIAWADTVPKEILASIPKAEVKRQNAILELIQKEEEFLHDLDLLEGLFLARLEKPNPMTGDPPPIAIGIERDNFIVEVFSNHRELVGHIRKLVERLHVRQREESPIVINIGDIFLDAALEWAGAFETNMTNFPIAKNRISREAAINPRFQEFLESCRREPACHRLPMDHFLQRATTRLPRYNLHFKSILQDTESSNSDQESLARAIEIIDEQCKSIQKGVAAAEIKVKIREYAYNLATKRNKAAVHMDLLNPERQLMHQGRVYRKPDFTDFEWQDLLAVLFDNYLVVTKTKRREESDSVSSKFILAKRPIPVEMMQLVGFNDASVSRSIGLSNFHLRSNSERDSRDLYPFTIAHIGGKMEPLTLYVPSKAARDEWKSKLEEAIGLRAAVQEANKVFDSHVISPDIFALPLVGSLDAEKAPIGVDPSSFHGLVTCAVPFQTMDGRRLIAIGCADGVWIGLRNDPRSLRKVLHLKLVSQCAVLESFGIFIVLADKVLISYSLEALVPSSASNANPRPPQKLSGNRDVLFFSVGQLRDRTLLVYMKKKANESVFRALEPVVSSIQSQGHKAGSGGLFGKFGKDAKGSDWFRIYKTFFIPSEAYSMQFLRSKLCIVCARGFEIINLDSLLPGTIPDFSQSPRDDPRIQQLAKRVETARPLGMFKNNESEFLLCYDAFACYVDRLGEPIRLDNIIEWEGVPRSVAFRSPFILAFDQRFIEVRDSASGQLVQLIRTNDLRNISGSSTTTSSIEDEDEDAIILAQRVRSQQMNGSNGQRLPSYDHQQVFQLVSTAYYRQMANNVSQGHARDLMHDESGTFRGMDLNRMATTTTYRTFASSAPSQPGSGWI